MRNWLGGLVLLAVGLWTWPSDAAISVVQAPAKCETSTDAGSQVCSFGSAVSAGSTVIITASVTPAPPTSTIYAPTDTALNSYQYVTYRCSGTTTQTCISIFRADNVIGGFTTVTITQSTPAKWIVDMLEVSGLATAAQDGFANNRSSAGTTSFSSGTTPTTTTPNSFVVAALGVNSTLPALTFTISGGWTERARETNASTYGAGLSVVTKTGTSLATYEHTWTGVTTQGPPTLLGVIATFKEAPAVGANTLPTGCTFTWNLGSETDLAGYYLYVDLSTVTLGATNRHDVGLVTTATCNAMGINTDGTYHAQLSAYDSSRNESTKVNPAAPYATSFTLSGTSGPQTLVPPTLTAPTNGVSPTQTVFSWNPVTGATGYIAHVQEIGQTPVACNPALTTNSLPSYCATFTGTQFTLDLLAETDYQWWVCTINPAGTCGLSNGDSFTTGTATPLSARTVTWSFSGLDTSGAKTTVSGFRINRASSVTGPWTLIGTVAATVRSYTDPTPLAPVSCYRIDVVDLNQTVTTGPVSGQNCTVSQGTAQPTTTTPPSAVFSVEVE